MTAQSTETVATEATAPQHGAELIVPLNRLKASPKNARKTPHAPATIEALAASIKAKGVLQPPVIEIERTEEGEPTGNYLVTIGEGRRQGLRLLAKRKAIKRTHPVRVIVDAENDAHEISLDENMTREAMHPADQFEAFQRLAVEKGYGPEEIGARFGAWVVHTEMRGLINEADEIELIERRESEQDTKLANSARKRVDEALARLRAEVGEGAEPLMDDVDKAVSRLTAQSSSLVDRIEKVIAEADSEREKFVYLAGIGLMTEFIFHELDRAVSHTMDLLAGGSLRQSTIDSLREQLKTLQKRIAAFDELTGEKRQSKSTFDLGDLADEVLSNHAREFDRHGIRLVFNRPDTPLVIKAVRGMLIQILENLIVNSAYWLKQQERFQPGFDPKITVTLDAAVRSLTVEDNGPGVAEDRKERIFQPFITSKPTGQGRGLGLYIARELAEYHGWKLYMDSDVGRVRKDRLNMFVLDMG